MKNKLLFHSQKKKVNKYIYILLFSFFILSAYCYWQLHRTIVLRGEKKIFLIEPKSSSRDIIANLKKTELIHSPFILQCFSDITGKRPFYPGEYLIVGPASTISIWRQLVSGKGLYQRSFMIVPGMTIKQLFLALSQNPFLQGKEILHHPQDIAKALQLPNVELEGWFLPETYFYTRGTDVMQILERAHDLMKRNLLDEWSRRKTHSPFKNPYEALIAASLVEREAYFSEDKDFISSVLINRLHRGMRLQFDPTVIYALGDAYQGKLTKKDLQFDSPFNSYRYSGLPPTPIALPSKKTLRAVLQAPETDFLYFVLSGKDKHHVFSSNLAAHQHAVQLSREERAEQKTGVLSCAVQYLQKTWNRKQPFFMCQSIQTHFDTCAMNLPVSIEDEISRSVECIAEN